MKRHGKARGCVNDPAKSPIDIFRETSQRAEFELEVYRVEPDELITDFLDVAIAERAHGLVPAAQQILIEVEDGDVEEIRELPFEGLCVGSDAAKLVAGRNDREPGASRRQDCDAGSGARDHERAAGLSLANRHAL